MFVKVYVLKFYVFLVDFYKWSFDHFIPVNKNNKK